MKSVDQLKVTKFNEAVRGWSSGGALYHTSVKISILFYLHGKDDI